MAAPVLIPTEYGTALPTAADAPHALGCRALLAELNDGLRLRGRPGQRQLAIVQ